MKFVELINMTKGEFGIFMATVKVKTLREILKSEGVRGTSKMKKAELVNEIHLMIDNVDSNKIVIDIDEDIDKRITSARQMNEMFSVLFNYPKKDDVKLIDDEIEGVQKSLQYNMKEIDKIVEHKKSIDEINNEILKDTSVELRAEYFINKKGEVNEYIYLCGGETYINCSYHNIQKDDFLWIEKGIIPSWFDLDAEGDDDIKDNILYYYYDDSYIAINPYTEDIIDFDCTSDEIEKRLMDKFGFKLEFVTNDFVDAYIKDTDIVFSIDIDSIVDGINGEVNIDRYRISYEKLIEQRSKYESGVRYIDVAYKDALDE